MRARGPSSPRAVLCFALLTLLAACPAPPPAAIPEPATGPGPAPSPPAARLVPRELEPPHEPAPNPDHRAQFNVYGLLFDVVGTPVETRDGWAVTLTVGLHNTHRAGSAQLGPEPHVQTRARLLYGERKRKLWAVACLAPKFFDPAKLLTLAPGASDQLGLDRSEDEVRPGHRLEGELMTCGVRTPTLAWTSLPLAAYVLEVDEHGEIAEFQVRSLVD